MPVRVIVTAGTVHDCKEAIALIDGIAADYLLADKGYDSNAIIDAAIAAGMETLFYILSVGEELLHDMRRIQHLL